MCRHRLLIAKYGLRAWLQIELRERRTLADNRRYTRHLHHMTFHVEHYDGSESEHDTLAQAIKECETRLEPWRENTDTVMRQPYSLEEIKVAGCYVFVVNECGEPTDAESYITIQGETA